MSADGKRYEIRTVADFLQIPADRRELCLKEFGAWLEIHEQVSAINAATVALGVELKWNGAFSWIDDNEGNFTIRIMAPEVAK